MYNNNMIVLSAILLIQSIVIINVNGVPLKYMSFWQFHPLEQIGWLNIGVQGDVRQIEEGHQLNMTSLFIVESIFFIDNPDNTCNHSDGTSTTLKMLNPNYKQLWNDQYNTLSDLFSQQAIIGFFLGDGLVAWGVDPSDINMAAQFIKENMSSSIIYMNEGSGPVSTGLDYCNNHHEYTQISSYVDWFSVSLYHYDNDILFVNNTVKPFYEKYVFSKMNTNEQYAFCVPGSFGSNNNDKCDEECYEEMCINDANQFYEWGMNDERIIGLMPWHWISVVDNTSNEEIGTKDMPQTRANWERIGKLIIASDNH